MCVRMRTDFSYSNTVGWNTFPVPTLTDKNEADLTRCAEDILLAREHHFPATIADLYDRENMPADLRAAHDRNDELLQRLQHAYVLWLLRRAAQAAPRTGACWSAHPARAAARGCEEVSCASP
ncbi:MAG: type IIL restriction-modification enzyme MmeI [Hydrogenophaga sp.]